MSTEEYEAGTEVVADAAKDVEAEEDSSEDLKKVDDVVEGVVDDHAETDPPMREVQIGQLVFNPITSFIGIAILWGVSAWCMVDPENSKATLIGWRKESALSFTWFYIGTRPLFFFYVIYVAMRYGNVRLGAHDSKPEFSTLAYFTMLFSAGVAVGLFFYGVSEPLWHQNSHWYANSPFRTQDEEDQMAMTITIYHWGLAAWAGYVLVAVCLGLAAYRFNLPLTMRTALYPIFGKYTWGWIGDLIDGFTIVVTVAGVCTSLGLGSMQIMAGLQRINAIGSDLTESEETNVQIATIWIITIVATISVVSGLHVGIKFLSNLAFILGQILLLWVLSSEKTAYLLNFMVQSLGNYLHYSTFLLNFWTDPFGQMRNGEGRDVPIYAVNGGTGAVEETSTAAAVWWMDAWTVFYMAWWTAWSGFVGMFVARISKGRTVREVVVMGTVVPLIYELIWFCTFGGTGLRQARQAMELQEIGETIAGDRQYFVNSEIDYCYDVPQQEFATLSGPNGTYEWTNYALGITPVCVFNSGDANNAWFNVLFSFSYPNDFDIGFGYVFSVVSLIAISIYFITSSDSGSLIVDHLASNGREEHFWGQRVFWAFTEGAVATALLVAGGAQALQALQAASIIAGLPFTAVMCYMCQSIQVMCEYAEDNPEHSQLDLTSEKKDFKTPVYGGIFNIVETILSFGNPRPRLVELEMHAPVRNQAAGFIIALVAPMVPLWRILNKTNPKAKIGNAIKMILFTCFFILWVALFISITKSRGLRMFGWTAFFGAALILTGVKHEFREAHNIRGNIFADAMSSSFVYPQVLVQIDEMCDELGLPYNSEE